jgi:aryl-alcohol dehydrogenase-like predicted oxidoreductase
MDTGKLPTGSVCSNSYERRHEIQELRQYRLEVSELCLGCMTFGVPDRGDHPWTLPEEPSRALISQAVDAGINYFDTANSYSEGTSEEIVGRALKDFSRRDQLVMATKVFFPHAQRPKRRRTIPEGDIHGNRRQPAAAWNRLRGPLPDPSLGLLDADRGDSRSAARRREERQSAVPRRLIDVRLAIQQIPASRPAARLDLFVSMQSHYNLLYREEEREMMPLCTAEQIAVVPWSPLARGRLTREWDSETPRTRTDEYGNKLYIVDADRKVVEHVATIAAARGVPKAQVALAWISQKSFVTAPIVGASKPQHLDDAVAPQARTDRNRAIGSTLRAPRHRRTFVIP